MRTTIRKWYRELRFKRTYERFQEYTMIPPQTYLNNLHLAKTIYGLRGCVVECGVWRGGMIAGIAEVLGPNREYFLFDSFEGLPSAKDIDGSAALEWQRNTSSEGYHNNCSAPVDFAEKAMRRSAVRSYYLHKGWFDQTLPHFKPPSPIALLRLDADWYDSTIMCLERLYDYVAPGGLIVIDDYFTWDGCSKAVHDFLSSRKAAERIRAFDDVCYLIKEERPT
jgi:O-methyltransferase